MVASKYSAMSNEALLEQYRDLDTGAFKEFYKRNSPLIFNFLASRLRDRAEAEDALQETFFRIHKYILSFDPSQNALAWIFTIARNCLLDRAAVRGKAAELGKAYKAQLEQSEIDFQKEASEELEALLAPLSKGDRELLEKRFLAETSYEDLAKEFDASPAGMRQRVSRLLRKLRASTEGT